MANYAVCTECDFLRVRAKKARGVALPNECPQCGARLVVVDGDVRFQPAYVSRVSLALHGTGPLKRPDV